MTVSKRRKVEREAEKGTLAEKNEVVEVIVALVLEVGTVTGGIDLMTESRQKKVCYSFTECTYFFQSGQLNSSPRNFQHFCLIHRGPLEPSELTLMLNRSFN